MVTGLIMVEERTEYGFWVLLGLFGEAERARGCCVGEVD
jgi:hypothetical protein